MDAIAAKIGVDGVEIRRRNLIAKSAMPYELHLDTLGTHIVYDSGDYALLLDKTLALAGWDTLPATTRVRYPEIELDAAMLANVDHVLLSSEPYRFRERDIGVVQKLLPPGAHCSVRLIDGEMTSWYGSRAIRGLDYLVRLRRAMV